MAGAGLTPLLDNLVSAHTARDKGDVKTALHALAHVPQPELERQLDAAQPPGSAAVELLTALQVRGGGVVAPPTAAVTH
jgi:hypothetical protein